MSRHYTPTPGKLQPVCNHPLRAGDSTSATFREVNCGHCLVRVAGWSADDWRVIALLSVQAFQAGSGDRWRDLACYAFGRAAGLLEAKVQRAHEAWVHAQEELSDVQRTASELTKEG